MDKEILPIILILILFILFGAILFINNSKKIDNSLRKRIWSDLLNIKKMLDTKNPLIFRDIIIRLDQLLAKSLKVYFKNTDSCGENLKKARDLFPKNLYNEIWEIHKLRNRIVHENDEVNASQVRQGYNIISQAIKKMLYG